MHATSKVKWNGRMNKRKKKERKIVSRTRSRRHRRRRYWCRQSAGSAMRRICRTPWISFGFNFTFVPFTFNSFTAIVSLVFICLYFFLFIYFMRYNEFDATVRVIKIHGGGCDSDHIMYVINVCIYALAIGRQTSHISNFVVFFLFIRSFVHLFVAFFVWIEWSSLFISICLVKRKCNEWKKQIWYGQRACAPHNLWAIIR